MSIAALLTIAKIWKQSECQSMDEYIKTIGCDTHTHTQWDIVVLEEFCSINDNMDEPGEHYTQ